MLTKLYFSKLFMLSLTWAKKDDCYNAQFLKDWVFLWLPPPPFLSVSPPSFCSNPSSAAPLSLHYPSPSIAIIITIAITITIIIIPILIINIWQLHPAWAPGKSCFTLLGLATVQASPPWIWCFTMCWFENLCSCIYTNPGCSKSLSVFECSSASLSRSQNWMDLE